MSSEFKSICNEQLADFKTDYRKFIELETPLFIEQLQKDKQNEMLNEPYDFNPNSFNLADIGSQPFNTVPKSTEQEAYDQVDKLN